MTQDEIIEMAEKVKLGSEAYFGFVIYQTSGTKELEAFAKLVAAKEREACSKACLSLNLYGPYSSRDIQFATLKDCARAIRNRSEK
jgi:hypothetical protein